MSEFDGDVLVCREPNSGPVFCIRGIVALNGCDRAKLGGRWREYDGRLLVLGHGGEFWDGTDGVSYCTRKDCWEDSLAYSRVGR